MTSPKEFGLPHDEWYPNQEMAALWISNQSKTTIIEAPTGSGKTGLAAVQAFSEKTLALMRTKFLQQENYENGYGFIPLYGKSNYPCVNTEAPFGTMADGCLFNDEGMARCPVHERCDYYNQKILAQHSRKTALNYAYWLHVYNRWPAPDVLVMDEAHQLSSITLEWAGCTVSEKDRQEFSLPSFPFISNGSTSVFSSASSPMDRTESWIAASVKILSKLAGKYNASAAVDSQYAKMARKAERMQKKLESTVAAMSIVRDGWYIRSGPNALGENQWGLVAKPLTARYHFPHYFLSDEWRAVIMSATIGNPEVFTAELGIDDYAFLSVPNVWPAETRPVHALDVPRLGHKSPESAYEKQADEIAKAIKSCDPNWSGVIHSTSIMEAQRIARRLHKRGLHDRVVVSDRLPTNQIVEKWRQHLKRHKNAVLCTWALWEGYDGTAERINIAAKAPYPFLGDPYEKERQRFDGKFFLQRTAWQLEQGLGRTRRGKESDYDTEEKQNGFVAIADGGWKWLRNFMSKSLLESIVA